MIIPPRSSAVPSTADPDRQSTRDRHIQLMAERGRIAWQGMTGYGRRNAAETTMARYKRLIGPKLRARNAAAQAGEVALAIQVLNRMIARPSRLPYADPDQQGEGLGPPLSGPCTKAIRRGSPREPDQLPTLGLRKPNYAWFDNHSLLARSAVPLIKVGSGNLIRVELP